MGKFKEFNKKAEIKHWVKFSSLYGYDTYSDVTDDEKVKEIKRLSKLFTDYADEHGIQCTVVRTAEYDYKFEVELEFECSWKDFVNMCFDLGGERFLCGGSRTLKTLTIAKMD